MCDIFSTIGTLTVLAVVASILWRLYLAFVVKVNLGKYIGNNKDSWAVITGSTDGIGLAYAKVHFY